MTESQGPRRERQVVAQRRIIGMIPVAYLSHSAHTYCHWDAAGQALGSEG
jgi:hypothetical protein